MMLHSFTVDVWSIICTCGIWMCALMTNIFGLMDTLVLKWIVTLLILVPKTSSFDALKNKPLKFLRKPCCSCHKDLQDLMRKINQDPNLIYAGVNEDISIILKCLFNDKELLVTAMDNIIISKRGVELLIYEFEKTASDEAYDRSIFIDIADYRRVIFQWRSVVVMFITLISLLILCSHYVRSYLA